MLVASDQGNLVLGFRGLDLLLKGGLSSRRFFLCETLEARGPQSTDDSTRCFQIQNPI